MTKINQKKKENSMENKIGKILIDWLNDRNRNFQVLDTETYFDLSLPEKELYILKETLFDDFKVPEAVCLVFK